MTLRGGRAGFSVIEMLIALAVIGIAFAALAVVQVGNLRASSRSRLTTDTKAVANQVLEKQMADVLGIYEGGTDGCGAANYDETETDSSGNPVYKCFRFTDYYWQCPSLSAAFPASYVGHRTKLASVDCGNAPNFGSAPSSSAVDVSINIAGGSGTLGEGILNVAVTAKNKSGPEITLGDTVTCYDVYPSPSVTAPAPCPEPDHGR